MSATSSPDDLPRQRRYRAFFIGTTVLTASWLILFALLVLFTANPITLNWQQMQKAQTVVAGTVVNKADGTIKLDRFWKNDPRAGDTKELRVINLNRTIAEEGETYLFPLVLAVPGSGSQPDGYEVPLTQEQEIELKIAQTPATPLIYPLSDDAVEQLEELLRKSSTERDIAR